MAINFPTQPKCTVHNCGKPQVAKGFCETHYKRLKRHGTVSDDVGKKVVDGVLISRHPLYSTWRNITRTYGGTVICDEWKDFATFVRDAGEKPEDAYALKRIDIDGKFSPNNVRWAIRERDVSSRKNNAENQRRFRKANPEYHRSSELRKKYNITLDDYNKMLSDQGGVCAICGNPETRVDKRIDKVSNLAVDHCHDTGKVRGLLCHACNAMLGQSGDSVERLGQGIAYLKNHM